MFEYDGDQEFCELAKEIEENSPYKKKPSSKRKMMTVHEMGDLLGIHKTDRHWLVNKGLFKTKIVMGKTWIDIESFENWYANQVKYQKITGEEPGLKLKEWSYSPQEMAEVLGISDYTVYELIKRDNIETVTVDYWMRIPKSAFDKWYKNQKRYRTREDREKDAAIEAATITMPEMARLLGVTRGRVYSILKNEKYKDLFEIIVVAEKKRITKESFQKFLEIQNRYKLDERNDYKEVALEENIALANYRRNRLYKTNKRQGNGNQKYLTRNEAALLAGVSKVTVGRWEERGCFPVVRIGSALRIPRAEFEDYLKQREEMEGLNIGINSKKKR